MKTYTEEQVVKLVEDYSRYMNNHENNNGVRLNFCEWLKAHNIAQKHNSIKREGRKENNCIHVCQKYSPVEGHNMCVDCGELVECITYQEAKE